MENLPALVEELEKLFAKKTSAEWLDALDAAGVPAGPIFSITGMPEHPQAIARDMVVTTEHASCGAVRGIGMPVKFHGTAAAGSKPPPVHGQHTDEILRGMGMADDDIELLRKKGAIL